MKRQDSLPMLALLALAIPLLLGLALVATTVARPLPSRPHPRWPPRPPGAAAG
jgi:hypothetical protein